MEVYNMVPDWIGILIAAVLNMAIGAVWYSHWLFGDLWLKITKEKELHWLSWRALIQFVPSFGIAFFIDFFERHLGVTTVTDGMFVSFCFWLGFVAPTQVSSFLWGTRSWKLFAINGSYRLLAFLVMGGLIAS
ncbi:MAG TPA: DUF1761 domain-containing protein [Chlamydiales bacterium]|nr:MAG: hypothetical protein A3F67_08260 [Verrucomicrobia bacterium RIFCSPHIGHO2_12_FULL_41_10]HLB53460.1 DUF1761 domain-containing protein [Chlamydiales bacterium]